MVTAFRPSGINVLIALIIITGLYFLSTTSRQRTMSSFGSHDFVSSSSPSATRRRVSITIGSLNLRYSYEKDLYKISKDAVLESNGSNASVNLMPQFWGEKSWLLRGPSIADTVLLHNWDIFGFQEVIDGQLLHLSNWLGDEYDHIGVGRDDGKRLGESVPVFWKKDKFRLVNQHQGGIGEKGFQHFWLSPTPNIVASVGWDATLSRMCTHVSLEFLETKEVVHVFSTHYDHEGIVARARSSQLIVDRARKASQITKTWLEKSSSSNPFLPTEKEPLVILIGDLNSPRNEGSWSTLVAGHYQLPVNSSGFTFLDTALSVPTVTPSPYLTDDELKTDRDLAAGRIAPVSNDATVLPNPGYMHRPYGSVRTFTGFQLSHRHAIDDRIDFIMLLDNHAVLNQTRSDTVLQRQTQSSSFSVTQQPSETKSTKWMIRTHGVLPNWSQGDSGFLFSDHRPIMTRIDRVLFHP